VRDGRRLLQSRVQQWGLPGIGRLRIGRSIMQRRKRLLLEQLYGG
jgi:hypothetical protein